MPKSHQPSPNYKLSPFITSVKNVSEQIANQLMDAILQNKIKGGDRLVELELQEVFGVSRSPIREALRELEKRGLVEIVPRKGTYVKRISLEDIEENFPVRAVLERLAAKIALRKMSRGDIEVMGDVLALMRTAVEQKDTKIYWERHLEFHEIFITACGNQVLIEILRTLRMHTLWHRFSYHYFQKDLQHSLLEHERIFKLFKGGPEGETELLDLTQNHIEKACDKFIDYLEREDLRKPE